MGVGGDMVKSGTDDFIGRVNVTLAHFKFAHSDTLHTLFKAFCMALYGCQLWDYSSKEVNYFYKTWRKCVRRVWRLPPRTHNELLHLICGEVRVEQQLHRRLAKFLKALGQSDNELVHLCLQLTVRGSRSPVANSVALLSHRYGWDREGLLHGELISGLISTITRHEPSVENDTRQASFVRELISMRDRKSGPLSPDEADVIIENLCVD